MRLRFSACSAALWILAACGSPAAAPQRTPQPGDWTQFRLNPQHDATLPGNLRVAWRVQTGGGFSSSPAVTGGTLYIGNNAGSLFALDFRTGKVRWQQHVASSLMSNPILWNGIAIVGEGNEQSIDGDATHPIIVGAGEEAIVAFDAQTGARRWTVPLTGSGMPSPAIVGSELVHHNGHGVITIVDPASGRVRSAFDIGSVASMSAILPQGSDAFITAGGAIGFSNALEKRDVRDGSSVWILRLPQNDWGVGDCPPAANAGRVFCTYVRPRSNVRVKYFRAGVGAVQHVYAAEASTGHLLWDTSLESGLTPKNNLAAVLLAVGSRLYAGSALAPYVHALSSKDGHVLWRLRVNGPVKGGIAYKDGTIYFGDLGGYLWAVNARTGERIGAKAMHAAFNVGSPVIVGNTLFVGSKTGAIIAIPLAEIRSGRE